MMSATEFITLAYGLTNIARVAAYVPQLRRLARLSGAPHGVSAATWWMFCVSHATTAAYMGLVVKAVLPTLLFLVNAAFSWAIASLAAHKQRAAR